MNDEICEENEAKRTKVMGRALSEVLEGTLEGGVLKMKDGKVYVKVIQFPVPEGSPFLGESMWVTLTSGDEFHGTGIVRNVPVMSTVKWGTEIAFTGGTQTTKPFFLKVVGEGENNQ